MTSFKHPKVQTLRGVEPAIRQRLTSTDVIKYTITAQDTRMFQRFPLHAVAIRFYDDESLWELLAEVNPLKDPSSWVVGDVVLVPRDWQTLLASSVESSSVFQRKVY